MKNNWNWKVLQDRVPSPNERRILLTALRAQERALKTRLRVLTLHAHRGTKTNLEADLKTTEDLLATLQG